MENFDEEAMENFDKAESQATLSPDKISQ